MALMQAMLHIDSFVVAVLHREVVMACTWCSDRSPKTPPPSLVPPHPPPPGAQAPFASAQPPRLWLMQPAGGVC